MNRLLAAAAILALAIVPPTVALAVPGENGPPEWAGNDQAAQANDPADPGPPATPPGNSGSNPQGGPPGLASAPPPEAAAGTEAPTGTAGETLASPENGAASNPGASPQGTPGSNGNGPAERITICHATHSETNPYVTITISSNGLHGHGRLGHQDDEDVIPVASNGSCSEPQQPNKPPEDGSNPNLAVAPGGGGGSNGGGPSAGDSGTLPFTGLPLAFLALAGVAAMLGGAGMRTAGSPQDAGEADELSDRRARLARDISAWSDSCDARASRLDARLTALERSLPE